MRASTREANLQALLADDSEVRSHVGDLLEAYKSTLAEDVRGTRLAHLIDAVHLTQQTDFAYDRKRLRESRLPDAVLTVFIQFLYRKHPDLRAKDSTGSSSTTSVSAQFLDKFSLCGVQYSTATCRSRDSHLFFRSPSMKSPARSRTFSFIPTFLIHPRRLLGVKLATRLFTSACSPMPLFNTAQISGK